MISELSRRLAALEDEVTDLELSREALETEHQKLQDENRKLRREMTLAHLIEDVQSVVGEELDDFPSTEAPSSARHFYDQLPVRFRFPHFFRMADEEDLAAKQARRFLVRYLADGRLVQSGAYLEKREEGE